MDDKIDFPEKPGYGRSAIRFVQSRLYEMAVAVKNVLEARGIPYMLAYGSLLGAVRHRGFIPWDDDFDFNLFDDGYDEAIAALKAELPPGMFVEDADTEPKYFHGWAHVKDLHTCAHCQRWQHDNAYAHRGVHLDLYRIKRMRGRDVAGYLMAENEAYLRRRRQHGLISDTEIAHRLSHLDAPCAVPPEMDEVEGYALINIYKCKFIPCDVVLPLRRYEFNGVEFMGPDSADCVLKSIYGDYWQLPPYEKRLPSFDRVERI